jgi:hypothetical protein
MILEKENFLQVNTKLNLLYSSSFFSSSSSSFSICSPLTSAAISSSLAINKIIDVDNNKEDVIDRLF